MFTTLIIETSTEKPLVAFTNGSVLLKKYLLPSSVSCTKDLVLTISQGLQELALTAASLHAVAVGIGPGSYTGIRVGVAVAKGIAFPKSLPLIGFSSLEGYVSPEEGEFISLIQARTGGCYFQIREKKANDVSSLTPPSFISEKEWNAGPHRNLPIFGPHSSVPDFVYLASEIQRRFENKEFGDDVQLAYLRIPEYIKVNL